MSTGKRVAAPWVDPLMNAASMAASITGTPINIQNMDNPAFQLVWTGSNPIGSLKMQVSLTWNPNLSTGTWTTYQTSPGTDFVITPGGVAGDYGVNLTFISFPWIRLIYTTAAGSVGNLTATYGAKAI